MTEATLRRTEALKLRQTISRLLDEILTIEHAIEMFHRKGDRSELHRAAQNFNEMLASVDRLGDTIADARDQGSATDHVRNAA